MTAAMFPAVTSSTISRSGPMNSETCWIRFLFFVPATWSSIPLTRRPEKTRPGGDLPCVLVHGDVGDHERGRAVGVGRDHRLADLGADVPVPDVRDPVALGHGRATGGA